MQARVWALYDRSRPLLIFLMVAFGIEVVAMSVILGMTQGTAYSTCYLKIRLSLEVSDVPCVSVDFFTLCATIRDKFPP